MGQNVTKQECGLRVAAIDPSQRGRRAGVQWQGYPHGIQRPAPVELFPGCRRRCDSQHRALGLRWVRASIRGRGRNRVGVKVRVRVRFRVRVRVRVSIQDLVYAG